MESFDHKMSKSDPGNAILLDDTSDSIKKKIQKSFLEVGNPNSPVFEIAKYVILPKLGSIRVNPNPKYGKPSEWFEIESFVSAVSDGQIHPLDAKIAIAEELSEVLSEVSGILSEKSHLLDQMNKLAGQS